MECQHLKFGRAVASSLADHRQRPRQLPRHKKEARLLYCVGDSGADTTASVRIRRIGEQHYVDLWQLESSHRGVFVVHKFLQ